MKAVMLLWYTTGLLGDPPLLLLSKKNALQTFCCREHKMQFRREARFRTRKTNIDTRKPFA